MALRVKTEVVKTNRQEFNQSARQDYHSRQQKTAEEIKEYLKSITVVDIQKILAKYGMDTDKVMTDNERPSEIIAYHPYQIENKEEWNKIKPEKTDRNDEIIKLEMACTLELEEEQLPL